MLIIVNILIEDDKKYVTVNGIHFVNIINKEFIENNKHKYCTPIEEFFTDDEWNMTELSNRHMIDLGGNSRDTPSYFAKNSAELINFEPVKHLQDLALQNVDLNKEHSDKITLVNKRVRGKTEPLKFNSNSVKIYANENSDKMEIISFQDLLNDYEFTPYILKMDCEGCEFEII